MSDTSSNTPFKKSYIIITIALALSGLSELASLFFIQPLLPTLSKLYHIPTDHISEILSVETAMLAIGLLVTGSLSDRFGRKRLIVTALFSGAVITCLCSMIHSWDLLVAMMGLLGLTLSGIAAAATAYISEEVPSAVASIVTGYFVFGNSMGGMSGRVFASQMIAHTQLHNIFLGFASLLFAISCLVLFLLPSSKNFNPTHNLKLKNIVSGMGFHLRNKKILPVYFIGFIIFGVFTSLYSFLTFHVTQSPLNLSRSDAGLISICFALSVISAPQAGRLSNKLGSCPVYIGLFITMIVGIVLSLSNSIYTVLAGVIIFTCCFFGCHSISLRWVNKHAEKDRGQATSIYLFFYYIGGSIVGYINGYIYSDLGWKGLVIFVAALLLVAIIIAGYLRHIPSEQAEAAAAS
ncbi:Inner membrane transport protein YnfM [Marinomonas spartinae]|uniref:Inner membrane transport protein YnfM n=1 Tax=Marinomonas spartinae TaxID=1792290 RepID=A0A1A8T8I1_9GAMM|nr:MFS transporter [Marinomonas spartinae]SBS27611.1 Inner membrane transport protein YnfM [Marinomonas spartinae]SBS30013.1 Inner membrane transport protein YnfM [Marinomonas spartinae]